MGWAINDHFNIFMSNKYGLILGLILNIYDQINLSYT